MLLTWTLLAFLEVGIAVDTYAAVALGNCVNKVGCAGYYRALGVSTSPANSAFAPTSNVTGVSVGAIGIQAATNGTNAAANVDVAGIRFKTPADTSDDGNGALSFYFGYLGVTGTWNNSTQTAAIAGALAEVISILSSVNVWYDNDNVAGFNWDISQTDATKMWNIFDNADGEKNGYDTLDVRGSIDLKNLTWTAIDHTKVLCNTQPKLTDASATCEIHSLTTSGSSSLSTTPVVTIVARIASQPVLINGNRHGPDRVKFDVQVQYPWAGMNSGLYSATKAKLALISLAAGKSGAFVGTAVKRADNSDSLVFGSEGNIMSYYAYKKTATVDGTEAAVTTQVVTGQQIIDYKCGAGSPCFGILGNGPTFLVALSLKARVAWMGLLGWKTSIAFHSLGTSNAPANVLWDPETGSVPTTEAANSAALAAPSLLFLSAIFLF